MLWLSEVFDEQVLFLAVQLFLSNVKLIHRPVASLGAWLTAVSSSSHGDAIPSISHMAANATVSHNDFSPHHCCMIMSISTMSSRIVQPEFRANNMSTICSCSSCRWVQYTADHDCSLRLQVSSEQQINSRLFAYVYCYRAESRQRVRGQMYGAEITLHCCSAFTFTDSATKRFYPFNLSWAEKAGSSDLIGGSWIHAVECETYYLISPQPFLLTCSVWNALRGNVVIFTAHTDDKPVSVWGFLKEIYAQAGLFWGNFHNSQHVFLVDCPVRQCVCSVRCKKWWRCQSLLYFLTNVEQTKPSWAF